MKLKTLFLSVILSALGIHLAHAQSAAEEFPIVSDPSSGQDPVYYVFGNPRPLVGKSQYDYTASDKVVRHLLDKFYNDEFKQVLLDRNSEYDEDSSQWCFELAGDTREDGYKIRNIDGTYLGVKNSDAWRAFVNNKQDALTWYIVPLKDIKYPVPGEDGNTQYVTPQPAFDGYAISLTPDGLHSIASAWAFNTAPTFQSFDHGGCLWIIETVDTYKLKELAYKLANASEWTAHFYIDILDSIDAGIVTADNIRDRIENLNEAVHNSITDEIFGRILRIESARCKWSRSELKVWRTHLELQSDGSVKATNAANKESDQLLPYFWTAEHADDDKGAFYLKSFDGSTYLSIPDDNGTSAPSDSEVLPKGTLFHVELAMEPYPGVYLYDENGRALGVDPESNGQGTVSAMDKGQDGSQWYIGVAPNTIKNIAITADGKVIDKKDGLTITAAENVQALNIAPLYSTENIYEAFKGISSMTLNDTEMYSTNGEEQFTLSIPKRFTPGAETTHTVTVTAIGGAKASVKINVVNPQLTAITAEPLPNNEEMVQGTNTSFLVSVTPADDLPDYPLVHDNVSFAVSDDEGNRVSASHDHLGNGLYQISLPDAGKGQYSVTASYHDSNMEMPVMAEPFDVTVSPAPVTSIFISRRDDKRLTADNTTFYLSVAYQPGYADFDANRLSFSVTNVADEPQEITSEALTDGSYAITLTAPEDGEYTVSASYGDDLTSNTLSIEYRRYADFIVGIDKVNADAADGLTSIHDLAGRPLKAITAPGVYIVNGKKIIVK